MKRLAKMMVALCLAGAASVSNGLAGDTKLKVMVYKGGQNLPLFVGQEQGFFHKHGLDVELLNASNSDELGPMLVNGTCQIIHSTSDNAVKLHDVDKIDVVLVIGGDNAHNHIIAQPTIKSFADLRGKAIALDGANTGYAYVLYAILKKFGVDRGEYDLKLVGATPKRLAALLSDSSNAAGLLNPPFSNQAVHAGLTDLGPVISFIGPYQGPAGYALRSWAKDHQDTLIEYLEACIEAVRWTLDPKNSAEAQKILARRLTLTPDVAAEVFKVITSREEGFAKDGKFDMAGFKNVLDLRASYEGAPAKPVESYVDFSYYDRALERLGQSGLN
jgi:ABC-type nitrate/sulfonate/bicarbonate transport system substrate-binding protein